MVGPRVRRRKASFSIVLFAFWFLAFLWVRGQTVHVFWKEIFYLGAVLSAEAVIANSLRLANKPVWAQVMRRVLFVAMAIVAWPALGTSAMRLPWSVAGVVTYLAIVFWQKRRA